MPVIDMATVFQLRRDGQSGASCNLLLLWSMFFVAASVSQLHLILAQLTV